MLLATCNCALSVRVGVEDTTLQLACVPVPGRLHWSETRGGGVDASNLVLTRLQRIVLSALLRLVEGCGADKATKVQQLCFSIVSHCRQVRLLIVPPSRK